MDQGTQGYLVLASKEKTSRQSHPWQRGGERCPRELACRCFGGRLGFPLREGDGPPPGGGPEEALWVSGLQRGQAGWCSCPPIAMILLQASSDALLPALPAVSASEGPS